MLNNILNYIVTIFREPAIFISFFAMLGLILQKKSFSDTVKGTLKTLIGVLILFVGVDTVIETITPLSQIVSNIFTVNGDGSLGDFSIFVQENSIDIGIVMLFSFLLNIIVAKITPFKAIFLTANLIFWCAMLLLALGSNLGIERVPNIIFAIFFTTLYLVVPSNLIKPYVKEITGNDGFTIGHTTSIFCFLGIFIGRVIGDPKKSAEDITLPKNISFFSDANIASGLIMFATYFLISIIDFILAGSNVKNILGDNNIFIYSLLKGMQFASGTVILLMGSRMVLTEIVPSFQGISSKLVPGSIPALDIPMIFPYGPNSLVIGFLVSLTTSILTIIILGISGILQYALIPLVIACYFDVAPGAIFANKRGGILAVVVSSAIGGCLLMIFCAFSLPLIANSVGTFIQTYGGNDFSLWLLLTYPIFSLLK